MPSSGYFDTPFGENGPLTPVPDTTQSNGSVSYNQGWGPNYTLEPGTAGALNVSNAQMNQIFNDITTAIQQYQQNGIPPFITSTMNNGSPYSYNQYATALYNGVAYVSNTNANTDTPPSSKWNAVILSSPNQFTGGTSTGGANAQVLASLSPPVGFSTSVNGQTITFTAGFTNTGSTTLAITSPSVSATTIKKVSGASLVNLTGGEIVASAPVYVTYDLAATCFVLQTGPALGGMAQLNVGNNMANDTNGNAVAQVPPLTLTGTNKTFTLGEWGAQISRSNSGAAMTDTLPGTSGAVPSGWYIELQNTDATASDTVSVGSGGSIFYGNQNLSSSGFIVEPGETWAVFSQGSGAYVVQRVATGTLHAGVPQSVHKKLAAVWASNTTASLSADAIVVQDANGNTRRLTSYSQTVNSATTGAGGLDTGSLTTSTWYYLYAIFNPTTNTQSLLMSASATSPTLPSGYTFASGPLSTVFTDGSSHFIGFTQYGNYIQWKVGSNLSNLPIVASGIAGNINTPTYVPVSISGTAAAPALAIAPVIKFMLVNPNGDTIILAPNTSYGSASTSANPPIRSAYEGNELVDVLLETSSVQWASNDASCALAVIGFTLNI